jgi:hypothetical protein
MYGCLERGGNNLGIVHVMVQDTHPEGKVLNGPAHIDLRKIELKD